MNAKPQNCQPQPRLSFFRPQTPDPRPSCFQTRNPEPGTLFFFSCQQYSSQNPAIAPPFNPANFPNQGYPNGLQKTAPETNGQNRP